MEAEDFYCFAINSLITSFDRKHDYLWQAGFNGRSGGYLVLYKGGKHKDGGVFSYLGKQIEDNEVPVNVLKDFRKLAVSIVKSTKELAKNYDVVEEEYTITKTHKVLT